MLAPPLSKLLDDMPPDSLLHARGLGSSSSINNNFTPHQVYIEECVAVTCASASIIVGFTASYWFIRMRRTFRHKLIMLLIQSDLWKAIWYFTYPVVAFIRGPVSSSSPFCQVTGFMVSLGTEASDFAILMIAVHATLYVFQTTAAMGEAGLYNHRHIAYVCWVIYPTLMASLAFVNPDSPYISSGTICALPVRPFWYRLALSWIPRYIIIFTILFLYLAIYVYVHFKFKGIDGESNGSHKTPSGGTSEPNKGTEAAPVPQIKTRKPTTPVKHGLLPSSDSIDPVSKMRRSMDGAPAWANYTFGGSQPVIPLPESQDALVIPSMNRCASTTSDATDAEAFRHPSHSTVESHGGGSYYILKALQDSRIRSFAPGPLAHMISSSGIQQAEGTTTRYDPAQATNLQQHRVGTAGLRKRHKDIKAKLRLLFIYPLVYMLLWLIPFIAHCLQYTDYYVENPPYPLNVMLVGILASQGAVDGILFSSREKPWRYVGKGRLLPWGKPANLAKLRRPSDSAAEGEESVVMTGVCDEEHGVRRSRESRRSNGSKRSYNIRDPKQETNWWDVEGRMRMDSVMLGTDHLCAEHGGYGNSDGPNVETTIKEEDDFGGSRADSGTGGQGRSPSTPRLEYGGLDVSNDRRRSSGGTVRRPSCLTDSLRSSSTDRIQGLDIERPPSLITSSLGTPGLGTDRRGSFGLTERRRSLGTGRRGSLGLLERQESHAVSRRRQKYERQDIELKDMSER